MIFLSRTIGLLLLLLSFFAWSTGTNAQEKKSLSNWNHHQRKTELLASYVVSLKDPNTKNFFEISPAQIGKIEREVTAFTKKIRGEVYRLSMQVVEFRKDLNEDPKNQILKNKLAEAKSQYEQLVDESMSPI